MIVSFNLQCLGTDEETEERASFNLNHTAISSIYIFSTKLAIA